MIQKMISFTKMQIQWLTDRKAKTGNSIASIVRTAVDEYKERHTPIFKFADKDEE